MSELVFIMDWININLIQDYLYAKIYKAKKEGRKSLGLQYAVGCTSGGLREEVIRIKKGNYTIRK